MSTDEEKARPKNIILLSDGTGNSASKLFKTNVWRLYQALDLSDPNSAEPGEGKRSQIAYYDDGVGTASFLPLALLGGAFGWGTKRNVLDLYTFLSRHYEEGDSVYGFGFSRGAFTMRVLTGLIANQGLVKTKAESELRQLAAEAFRDYRENRYGHYRLLKWVFRPLRNFILRLWYQVTGKKTYDPRKNKQRPPIKFLGLWDTVAAYGLPIDELTHAWDFIFPLSFPDRNLSDIVECACHALAIDDERLSFQPELWNENPEDYKNVPLGNRLTQVWFAGMHSNVGGGYPDDALSGVPLNWIMDRAEQAGLRFMEDERNRLKETASLDGKMYYSRQGLGGAYRYLPRKIKDLTHDDVDNPKNRVIIDTPKIHESVLMRIRNRVDGYAPIGLPEKYEVAAATTMPPIALESEEEGKGRVNRQRTVWNLVWWKRVLYFISAAIFTGLAAFPLYRPAAPHYDGPLYILSELIGLIGGFLPSFLGPWLKSYQSHPGLFLLIGFLFALVLRRSSTLQAKIFDEMRSIFDTPLAADRSTAEPHTGLIYRLRSNMHLRKLAKALNEKLIPWIILAIVAMFLLRGIFTIIDSSGLICTPTPGELHSQLKGDGGKFASREVYWASGVHMEEGKRYKITLTINGDQQAGWADSTIPATTGGFSKWYLIPWIPLRRHITEPWFKPIARIGKYGNDEYALDPVAGGGSNQEALTAEIKARRSGELFLFVNDAVLPLPKAWQLFYKNNHGIAVVNVEPLD